MSLLTNPWMQIGMGLLANSGPSLTPVNPWRGIGQGLMAANEAKVAETEQQYRQQMMARQQQEYEQEAQRQQMMQQWAQTQPDPVGASLFPEKAYEASLAPPGESAQMTTAGSVGIPGLPPETPVEVKMKGGQVVDYSVIEPPQAPQDPAGVREYEYAVNQGFKGSFTDYKQQMARASAAQVNIGGGLPANYRWIDQADPTKGVEPIPGGPATKPTDAQSLAGGFAERMSEAAASIDALEGEGYDPSTLGATMTPDLLAKPETRQYRQAQRDWVRAKLRKESGASIGEKEMEDEIKTYFPQPGDDAKTIEQKRRARITAERAMYRQAGPAAPTTQPTGAPEAPAPSGTSVFEKYPNLLRPPQ